MQDAHIQALIRGLMAQTVAPSAASGRRRRKARFADVVGPTSFVISAVVVGWLFRI